MNKKWLTASWALGMAGTLVTAGVLALALPTRSSAAPPAGDMKSEIQTLRDEIKTLRGQVPGQAHVMVDVGQHFSGLWFAVQHRNWDLAQFMYNETESHLRWAVRVRPVRKLSTGTELQLEGILTALENGVFDKVKEAIAKKDAKDLERAYRTAIDGCNSCHQAAEKPYLRVRVPVKFGELLDLAPVRTR